MVTVPNDREISGAALDSIPRNLIRTNTSLVFFDNEWTSNVPLPLSYLLYRSILSLSTIVKPETFIKLLPINVSQKINSLNDAIIALINEIKLFAPLNKNHAMIFEQFEQRFMHFAHSGKLPSNNESLLELFQKIKCLYHSNDLRNAKSTIEQIKNKYGKLPEVQRLLNILSKNPGKNNFQSYFSKSPKNGLTSIVILTFNQLNYTKQCVESIINNTPELHEIVFVDNGSKDGTVEWLKSLTKQNPNYTFIKNPFNKGFSVGYNQGINIIW